MAKRILVVDDEPSISTLLQYNLEQAGFEVETKMDGLAGFERAKEVPFDLIILDLMLPNMDGMDVCRHLRQEQIFVPILMLTAKDDEFDKVLGLELGADDYMTKPFSPREVSARVRAILRRVEQTQATKDDVAVKGKGKVIKDLTIYPDNYEVYVKQKLLTLTPKEFELLVYLAEHKAES